MTLGKQSNFIYFCFNSSISSSWLRSTSSNFSDIVFSHCSRVFLVVSSITFFFSSQRQMVLQFQQNCIILKKGKPTSHTSFIIIISYKHSRNSRQKHCLITINPPPFYLSFLVLFFLYFPHFQLTIILSDIVLLLPLLFLGIFPPLQQPFAKLVVFLSRVSLGLILHGFFQVLHSDS